MFMVVAEEQYAPCFGVPSQQTASFYVSLSTENAVKGRVMLAI